MTCSTHPSTPSNPLPTRDEMRELRKLLRHACGQVRAYTEAIFATQGESLRWLRPGADPDFVETARCVRELTRLQDGLAAWRDVWRRARGMLAGAEESLRAARRARVEAVVWGVGEERSEERWEPDENGPGTRPGTGLMCGPGTRLERGPGRVAELPRGVAVTKRRGMGIVDSLGLRAVRMLSPERAHRATVRGLKLGLGPKSRASADPRLVTTVGGLVLPNPVGLAAGFDKNAEVPDAMLRAGFGFVECGTVTPRPQDGNPQPRLFRLTEDEAVINRMGFNNEGLEAFAGRLAGRVGRDGIVGANLGANKDSADRVGDYVLGLKRLWGLSDYFTVNISSPNTPGLRSLQDDAALAELLSRIAEARAEMAADGEDYPVFLKVAPDLADGEAARIVEQVIANDFDGVIVSNTTLSRDGLRSQHRDEAGGMSGRPLFARSTEMLREFARASKGRVPLIGVGGIASAEDAYGKIRAGASAVQIYSALVYQGTALVERINSGLVALLERDGYSGIADAVGTELETD